MKYINLTKVIGYALGASLVFAPLSGFAKNDEDHGAHDPAPRTTDVSCVQAFGHLIAAGWIAHHGTTTVDSNCVLPFGIRMHLGLERPPHEGQGDHAGTTTPDTMAPHIFLLSSNTGTSTARVTWYTNERADSQVAYGTTTAYGSTTTLNPTLTFFHSVTLSGLASSTLYHFQVRSRDAGGNLATSSDRTLTTHPLPDTTPPTISALAVSGIASTTATVSWTTNEPATSKVYYASGTSLDLNTAATVTSTALVTNHTIVLSGLSASTTYSYAVQSKDAANNATTSTTHAFVTSL